MVVTQAACNKKTSVPSQDAETVLRFHTDLAQSTLAARMKLLDSEHLLYLEAMSLANQGFPWQNPETEEGTCPWQSQKQSPELCFISVLNGFAMAALLQRNHQNPTVMLAVKEEAVQLSPPAQQTGKLVVQPQPCCWYVSEKCTNLCGEVLPMSYCL